MQQKAFPEKAIRLLCFAIIMIGIVLRIAFFVRNDSFWGDEAALAASVCKRSLSTLVATPLDNGQSAPIVYLYIVKLLAVLFGDSRWVLRLWSLVSGILCIALFYVVAKQVCRVRSPEWFTAVFAVLLYYIEYSVEFKQYMSENLLCLCVVLLASRYENKRISLSRLCLLYSVIIWVSFLAVLLIAGHMVTIAVRVFLTFYRERKAAPFVQSILCCAAVFASFCINYVFWLSDTKAEVGQPEYWNNLSFPLIPTSSQDLRLILQMAARVFTPVSNRLVSLKYIFVVIALLFMADCIAMIISKKMTDLCKICLPGILLMLVASWLGFYPIETRLVQFVTILLLLFCAEGADICAKALRGECKSLPGTDTKAHLQPKTLVIPLLVSALALVSAADSIVYFNSGKYFHLNGDPLRAIAYLKENATDTDKIYISSGSGIFDYEYGYPEKDDRLIYGQQYYIMPFDTAYSYSDGTFDEEAMQEDFDLVKENPSVYLLFISLNELKRGPIEKAMQNVLSPCGTLTMVMQDDEMFVFHFQRAPASS